MKIKTEISGGQTEEKPDIFDRLFAQPFLGKLGPLLKKYKEYLLYVLFGGGTFVVSMVSYWISCDLLGIHVLISNVISWIFAVAFAYITNRTWVFSKKAHDIKGIIREVVLFCVGRLVTLGVEEVILFTFVTTLKFNELVIKLIAQIVVIILNYVFSKLLVFRDSKK